MQVDMGEGGMTMMQWASLIDHLEDANVKLEGEILLAGAWYVGPPPDDVMSQHGRLTLINESVRAALKLAREMATAERYSGG